MSTAAEKRNSRGHQHQRQAPSKGSGQSGQQSKPAVQIPKQSAQQKPAQSPATNAWPPAPNVWKAPGIGRGKPAPTASTPTTDAKNAPSATSSGTATPTTSASVGAKSSADGHVAVRGFNSREVEEFLQKKYSTLVGNAEAEHECTYKPPVNTATKRNSMGVWGSKPNTMANGKDFWATLSQQIANAEGQHRGG